MSNMEKATVFFIALLKTGIEWPEAHTTTCLKFNVDGDKLTQAYDIAVRISCDE